MHKPVVLRDLIRQWPESTGALWYSKRLTIHQCIRPTALTMQLLQTFN